MTLHRIEPQEAKALLDEGYVYIDVRTEEEFHMGHPVSAYNIPWQFAGGRDNPDFLSTFKRHFEPGSKVILGCRSGNRSLAAARRLEQAGYEVLHELRTGYAGKGDPFGRIVEKGWEPAGLPTATEPEPGRDYRSLLEGEG